MIHLLLVLAAILFVVWVLFHAVGGVVHLLWLVILIAAVLWLFGLFRRRRGTGAY